MSTKENAQPHNNAELSAESNSANRTSYKPLTSRESHSLRALPQFDGWIAEQFAKAIEAAGLVAPDTIHADGTLHRFSATGRKSDKAGWYVLHCDGLPAGVFGHWRTGLVETWCSKPQQKLSAQERAELRHHVQHAKEQRNRQQVLRQQEAQQKAIARWEAAKPTHWHTYTIAKGIQTTGLRAEPDRTLLVPMRDVFGVLHSLQTITDDGSKRFLAGGRVHGCFHSIGLPGRALVVCEGMATAQSIHACTGLAVAAAFSAGNLAPVARELHQHYPHKQLLIAADDDHATEGNPGLTAARAAALAVGGDVVVPHFPSERPSKATDFNDLFSLAGADAVRACFAEVLES